MSRFTILDEIGHKVEEFVTFGEQELWEGFKYARAREIELSGYFTVKYHVGEMI